MVDVDEDVSVFCVIKFEFEFWLLLHKIVYTESTLLSFSNSGIKSSNSESDVSSNHDFTGTWAMTRWNERKKHTRMTSVFVRIPQRNDAIEVFLHFNTHCIFWMKDIARWTIIYNKNLLQITSQLVQILHIVSTMIYTWFAEKPRSEYIPPKKVIEKWKWDVKTS